MKYLKTYEGLFDFLKRKPKEVKSEYFTISDDMFQNISDIIGDADLMGLRVDPVQISGKRKVCCYKDIFYEVYSSINRGIGFDNRSNIPGSPLHNYYNELQDYDIDEMCYILTRLVDYVRSESGNKLNVNIDFIENGPHSKGGFRITNPSEASIHNQLSEFYGNLAHDWRTLKISIVPSK